MPETPGLFGGAVGPHSQVAVRYPTDHGCYEGADQDGRRRPHLQRARTHPRPCWTRSSARRRTSDVLVVDDNSPDGTADGSCARTRSTGTGCTCWTRPRKEGLGAAYRAGFAWALAPATTPSSRWTRTCPTRRSGCRRCWRPSSTPTSRSGPATSPAAASATGRCAAALISWAGNLYVRLVLGLPVHDTTAGLQGLPAGRSAADRGRCDSVSNGYCFQIENTWRACRSACGSSEVPITFSDRARGESKMSAAIVREAMLTGAGLAVARADRRTARPSGASRRSTPPCGRLRSYAARLAALRC